MPVKLKGLALELVSHQLELGDFFRVQATGTAMRTRCLEQAIWFKVMERKLSAFELHPALLQPEQWHILGPLFQEVQQTHAVVAGVALRQKLQIQRLTSTLHATNRSNQHVGPGQVFIGLMRFPDKLLPMAVGDQKSMQIRRRQVKPPSCIADAFVLQSNPLDDPAAGASASALNPVCVLSHGTVLYFGWQNGDLHLAIRDDGTSPGEIPMMVGNLDGLKIVTLDVAVSSSAFTLNHRSVEVAVNGPWTMCTTGFFVMTEGKAATVEALSAGVPCVVCIRFGQIMQPFGMACTLHLDRIRC
jgi:hypothetical protein